MSQYCSKWVQFGITSFFFNCSSNIVPNVFTRVSQYQQWITDTIQNHPSQDLPQFVNISLPCPSKIFSHTFIQLHTCVCIINNTLHWLMICLCVLGAGPGARGKILRWCCCCESHHNNTHTTHTWAISHQQECVVAVNQYVFIYSYNTHLWMWNSFHTTVQQKNMWIIKEKPRSVPKKSTFFSYGFRICCC